MPNCLSCNAEFTQSVDCRGRRTRTQHYCSRACQNRACYERKLARKGVVRGAVVCRQCGGPVPEIYRADRGFCTDECRYRFHYEQRGPGDRLRKFGLTVDAFDSMLAAQGGTCAVQGCGVSVNENGRRLHVDHDHACCPGTGSCGKCIRGLLCDRHNAGLGLFRDDPAMLRAAADYLEAARLRVVA